MTQLRLLEVTHEKLYWPRPERILTPLGAGPRIYAQLAQEKLGKAIDRDCQDGVSVRVGVLTSNPESNETEAPFAVVCDFNNPISQATLMKVYNLAWSFSRTQALITLEPHLLRVWSCCEEPQSPDKSLTIKPIVEIPKTDFVSPNASSLSKEAIASLYWIELVSGRFFQKHEDRFKKSHAADQMLLNNLRSVRQQLKELSLNEDIIHDLLARLIFIQFLFHRKDSSGKSALDEKFLRDLAEKKILSKAYSDLPEILTNRKDTYEFFRLLNDKFNGDLFPGKGVTKAEREREWQLEEQQVTRKQLNKLAMFVSGRLEMSAGQRCLWPLYSFDAVPLEFISSIYEEFVSKEKGRGTHYTPGFIVDFILDGVLPWDGKEWNLKILDPACGSGIFLVKAFQRLIHRWKNAHPGEEVRPKTLKSMLENCIFGVDINSHAVRVASFSLYLTMCDEIDPKHYWKAVKFPRLRKHNLIDKDFFREDTKGIRTTEDEGKFDLVVGNAPWERNSVTDLAKEWAKRYQWKQTITYGNIGPLFLPKTATLTKPGGRVSMIQPSGALIFNQVRTAKTFREKLYLEFKVEEIVNLSALRFGLYKNSISPSCFITICNVPPDGEPITYICPKPDRTHEDDFRIVVEPQDINSIFPEEAITEPFVWTALMWGSRRDFALIRRLAKHTNIDKLKKARLVKTREGIVRGDRKKSQNIKGRYILEQESFPPNTFLYLNAESLNINEDPKTDSKASTNFDAFNLPQIIIKQSWTKSNNRFQAAIINSDSDSKGVLCSQSYISVNVPGKEYHILEGACLSYNSKIAVYYLLLSSGRFASYRPEPTVEDLRTVPISEIPTGKIQEIKTIEEVDHISRQAFGFKESEWTLIEDLFDYTLPDFKGDSSSPGRRRTQCRGTEGIIEPELRAYCEHFIRVIKAGFGTDKNICAAIFQEQNSTCIPVRLVAFYLDKLFDEAIKIEPIDSPTLISQLDRLNKSYIEQSHKEGIFFRRSVRIYTSVQVHEKTVPTIYFVKPDKIRNWTRSIALRDADEVAADIMHWHQDLNRDIEEELNHEYSRQNATG